MCNVHRDLVGISFHYSLLSKFEKTKKKTNIFPMVRRKKDCTTWIQKEHKLYSPQIKKKEVDFRVTAKVTRTQYNFFLFGKSIFQIIIEI